MPGLAKQPGDSIAKLLQEYYSALRNHFGPQHWWPARTRLEVILGAILTQNTTWHNATLALRKLRKARLIHWQGLFAASLSSLEECVQPSGFYKQKARSIRGFADWLSQRYGGSLDRLFTLPVELLRRELLGLRGLGPETVDAIILYSAKRPVFVADAYTRRVLGRHGFLSATSDYHETQEFLHRHLPQDVSLYNEFHALLVEVGKNHCRRQSPECEGCPLQGFLPGGRADRPQALAEEPAVTGILPELQSA
jgi:endonuclease-3 related protein